jgi:uncharacterized protein (TIGR03435 family)
MNLRLLFQRGRLLAFAACVSMTLAQSTLGTDRPKFDVASIKENRSGSGPSGVSGLYRGDRFTATNIQLITLISLAYKVQLSEIAEAPSWVSSDRFDITAKADPDVVAHSQMLSLVQTLLEDRFQLVTHRETREVPVFALRVERRGAKIQAVSETDCLVPAPGTPPPSVTPGQPPIAACGALRGSNNSVIGRRVSITQLAKALEAILQKPVLDRTNLLGYFDFKLEWTPDSGGGADVSDRPLPVDAEKPSIFTAIHEQLGLEIRSERGPVEFVVIDHVQKPSRD